MKPIILFITISCSLTSFASNGGVGGGPRMMNSLLIDKELISDIKLKNESIISINDYLETKKPNFIENKIINFNKKDHLKIIDIQLIDGTIINF